MNKQILEAVIESVQLGLKQLETEYDYNEITSNLADEMNFSDFLLYGQLLHTLGVLRTTLSRQVHLETLNSLGHPPESILELVGEEDNRTIEQIEEETPISQDELDYRRGFTKKPKNKKKPTL